MAFDCAQNMPACHAGRRRYEHQNPSQLPDR